MCSSSSTTQRAHVVLYLQSCRGSKACCRQLPQSLTRQGLPRGSASLFRCLVRSHEQATNFGDIINQALRRWPPRLALLWSPLRYESAVRRGYWGTRERTWRGAALRGLRIGRPSRAVSDGDSQGSAEEMCAAHDCAQRMAPLGVPEGQDRRKEASECRLACWASSMHWARCSAFSPDTGDNAGQSHGHGIQGGPGRVPQPRGWPPCRHPRYAQHHWCVYRCDVSVCVCARTPLCPLVICGERML